MNLCVCLCVARGCLEMEMGRAIRDKSCFPSLTRDQANARRSLQAKNVDERLCSPTMGWEPVNGAFTLSAGAGPSSCL